MKKTNRLFSFIALMLMIASVNAANLQELLKSAEQGNENAQINLAIQYVKTKEYKQAAEWAKKSALQGNATAEYYLGILYVNGLGVTKNIKKSEQWLIKSAEQGYVAAQAHLSLVYIGSKKYQQAFMWAKKAALKGNFTAQYNTGYLYASGQGTSKSSKEAYLWFNIAKKNGYKTSQANSSIAYVKKSIPSTEIVKLKKRIEICLTSRYKQCSAE